MSVVREVPLSSIADEDLYPSSDGEPMAETELHGDEMTELKLWLRRYFRDRAAEVYVGCNLFVYYERGNPRAVFWPDVFVVHGAPQRQYDTYKLWLDGPAPCFVIEVSSKKTCVEDRGNKKAICEMLGVREYFLYDPRAEYLDPPLQGFRLVGGTYQRVAVDDTGALRSETLGLSLALDAQGLIALRDTTTGERLLRLDEERERVEAERQRAETERDDAKQRAAEAERKLAEALALLERKSTS